MARKQSTGIRGTLKDLFSDSYLEALGRETGFVQRQRKVSVQAFFWTLVLGFGTGSERTISSLRRAYQLATGTSIVPSAFTARFNAALVKLLRTATQHALASLQLACGEARGLASAFEDLFIADATIVKLLPGLARAFPGCRTNSAPAALKLHACLSVMGVGSSTIAITSERTSDLRKIRIGPWVQGRLLLFDLGYYHHQPFSRIARNNGSFITRLKSRVNPAIVTLHRGVRGNSIPVVGHLLQDVLGDLKREVLDVEVEVCFKRRTYNGIQRTARERFRIVAIRDRKTKRYHCYLTNVPPEVLDAESIAAAYRARWELELVFKELKSGYRLSQITSARREVAEALVYAAMPSLIVSRKLLGSLVRKHRLRRATTGRWWKLFAAYAQEILLIALGRFTRAADQRRLIQMLLHELQDPHTKRRGLLRECLPA